MKFRGIDRRLITGTLCSLVFSTGFLLAAPGASAQSTAGRISRPVVGQQDGQEPPRQLPPAVPGSKPAGSTAAPSDHPALDMPPTEALFDSINRGDLAGVKDAIGRGADLEGRNILGMTPLDLSVDLGRNEISFLLLSLRGSDIAPPARSAALPPPPPQKSARNLPPPREAVAPPATHRPAQVFAGGGGGAPVPNSGFLGFGTTAH